MKTEITVIVDNIADKGLLGEWGLSLLVEYGDRKILADAGASDLFLTNLEKLGFDVGEIDFAALSHAHYDHANGMPAFFAHNSRAKCFIRQGAAPNCYSQRRFYRKYIGIPRGLAAKYPDRIEFVTGDYRLSEGVWLIPHKTEGLAELGKREGLYRRSGLRWRPDDFAHEQSLVLDTEKGLVIINSCSHGGVLNILREVGETFPEKHIYGIIGGFHLFKKPEEEVRELAKKLKETDIEYVCTGHCTKDRAYAILKEELGDRAEQMRVGRRIVLSD